MDYVEAIEKARILEITIGMMELFPGMQEDSKKALGSVRKTKVFLEQGDWISAVASLEKIHILIRNYRENLPIIKLKNDYTLNSLEKNISYLENFLSRQIREEEGGSPCREKVKILRRSEKTSSTKLKKLLKRES